MVFLLKEIQRTYSDIRSTSRIVYPDKPQARLASDIDIIADQFSIIHGEPFTIWRLPKGPKTRFLASLWQYPPFFWRKYYLCHPLFYHVWPLIIAVHCSPDLLSLFGTNLSTEFYSYPVNYSLLEDVLRRLLDTDIFRGGMLCSMTCWKRVRCFHELKLDPTWVSDRPICCRSSRQRSILLRGGTLFSMSCRKRSPVISYTRRMRRYAKARSESLLNSRRRFFLTKLSCFSPSCAECWWLHGLRGLRQIRLYFSYVTVGVPGHCVHLFFSHCY